jgi:hypothetical protein
VEELLDVLGKSVWFAHLNPSAEGHRTGVRIPAFFETLPPRFWVKIVTKGFVWMEIKMIAKSKLTDPGIDCGLTHCIHTRLSITREIIVNVIIMQDILWILALK